MILSFADDVANARAAAILARVNAATDPTIELYAGAMPVDFGPPAGALMLSYTLNASTPATLSGRVLTFNAANPAGQAVAAGTVAWGRLTDDPAGTPVAIFDADASVAGGTGAFQLTELEYQIGAFATLTVARFTEP